MVAFWQLPCPLLIVPYVPDVRLRLLHPDPTSACPTTGPTDDALGALDGAARPASLSVAGADDVLSLRRRTGGEAGLLDCDVVPET